MVNFISQPRTVHSKEHRRPKGSGHDEISLSVLDTLPKREDVAPPDSPEP